MAVCEVLNISAEKVEEIELSDDIFGVEVQKGLLHEVVCMQRANRRRGTACTKTRGEVRGGGAKPWRQKGTGRARAGTNNSPIWRGGGTTFGPKPRDYSYNMPKKVKKLALKMALSARNQEGNLVVVDNFTMSDVKTKEFVKIMGDFKFDDCLLVTDSDNSNVKLSARNAVGYKVLPPAGLNVFDILKHSKLMLDKATLSQITERLTV